MTDLQQAVARAAVAALVDAYEREPDLGSVRYLTLELELKNGKPADARCWTECRVNVNKLLGVGRR